MADAEFGGVTIPEGDRVLLLIGSANRDVDVFGPDVDKYILGRDNGQSLMSSVSERTSASAPTWRASKAISAWSRVIGTVKNYESTSTRPSGAFGECARGFAELLMKVQAR